MSTTLKQEIEAGSEWHCGKNIVLLFLALRIWYASLVSISKRPRAGPVVFHVAACQQPEA